jgi:hypothetical protein
MSEWEYSTVNLSELPRDTGELDLLNDAGKDGWELVGITSNNIAYLKRQVRKPTTATTRTRPRATAK